MAPLMLISRCVYAWGRLHFLGWRRGRPALVTGLLSIDPAQRLTVAQVRQHPWFTQYERRCPPVWRAAGPTADLQGDTASWNRGGWGDARREPGRVPFWTKVAHGLGASALWPPWVRLTSALGRTARGRGRLQMACGAAIPIAWRSSWSGHWACIRGTRGTATYRDRGRRGKGRADRVSNADERLGRLGHAGPCTASSSIRSPCRTMGAVWTWSPTASHPCRSPRCATASWRARQRWRRCELRYACGAVPEAGGGLWPARPP